VTSQTVVDPRLSFLIEPSVTDFSETVLETCISFLVDPSAIVINPLKPTGNYMSQLS
jgi:hypothetical protein